MGYLHSNQIRSGMLGLRRILHLIKQEVIVRRIALFLMGLFSFSTLSAGCCDSLCGGMFEIYGDVKYRWEYFNWNATDGTNTPGSFKKFELKNIGATQVGGGIIINPFRNSCGMLNGLFIQVDGGGIVHGRSNRLNTKFVSGGNLGYTTLDNPKTKVRGDDVTVLLGKSFCVGPIVPCGFFGAAFLNNYLSNLELIPVVGYFYQQRRFSNSPGGLQPRVIAIGTPSVSVSSYKEKQEWQGGLIGIHTRLQMPCSPLTFFGGYEYHRGWQSGRSTFDVTEIEGLFTSSYDGTSHVSGHYNGFKSRSGVEYKFCSGLAVGIWYRFEWTGINKAKLRSSSTETTVGGTVPIPPTSYDNSGKAYETWNSTSVAINIGYEF